MFCRDVGTTEMSLGSQQEKEEVKLAGLPVSRDTLLFSYIGFIQDLV